MVTVLFPQLCNSVCVLLRKKEPTGWTWVALAILVRVGWINRLMTVEVQGKTAKIWRCFTKGSKRIQMWKGKNEVKTRRSYFWNWGWEDREVSNVVDITVLRENRNCTKGDFSKCICVLLSRLHTTKNPWCTSSELKVQMTEEQTPRKA